MPSSLLFIYLEDNATDMLLTNLMHKRTLYSALLILSISFDIAEVHAAKALPESNLSLPVLVNLDNGDSASGFYMSDSSKEYFVTARHVLFTSTTPTTHILKAKTARLSSYSPKPELAEKVEFTINLDALLKENRLRCHDSHDVCVAYIGDIKPIANNQFNIIYPTSVIQRNDSGTYGIVSSSASDIRKFAEVQVGNESYIFGYPSSIGIKQIPQIDYERPLIRKGIIAGKNIYNKTIILDCPVYFGNSGGPVIQVDREVTSSSFLLIGVVSQFVPFVEEWENKIVGYKNISLSNSGYSVVVPIDFVLELLWK